MEVLMEWLGLLLNNQKITYVDYDNGEQKEAIRLLRECDIADRAEGNVFVLHPRLKEKFDGSGKILSMHEKLALIKEELGGSPFATSPAKAELLAVINKIL